MRSVVRHKYRHDGGAGVHGEVYWYGGISRRRKGGEADVIIRPERAPKRGEQGKRDTRHEEDVV